MRIADPAQSKFAITVGPVCLGDFEGLDKISFGQRDTISSFSRTGLGMWGGIKPDVVEYGGDWVREKLGTNLSYENSINPLLIRAGGTGVDRGTVGTKLGSDLPSAGKRFAPVPIFQPNYHHFFVQFFYEAV